jgi:hypothetical protein
MTAGLRTSVPNFQLGGFPQVARLIKLVRTNFYWQAAGHDPA